MEIANFVNSDPERFFQEGSAWSQTETWANLSTRSEEDLTIILELLQNPDSPRLIGQPQPRERDSLWPDYVSVQGTILIGAFAFTMDTYSNIYFSGGFAGGIETAAFKGFSLRLVCGWIAVDASEEGIVQDTIPTEEELESFLRGLSFGGGGGYIGGMDASIPLSRPFRLALEPGIYTPQAGAGVTYGVFIRDNPQ